MTLARNLNAAIGCGIALVAVVTSASAFAGATTDQTAPPKNHRVAHRVAQKSCHVAFGSSAIPEPCDRIGEYPSTASPMHIIGGSPIAQTGR